MWTKAVVALSLLLVAPQGTVAAPNLREALHGAPQLVGLPDLGPQYRNAIDALIVSAARAVPVHSGASAFTYRFDPASGTYEQTSDTFGLPFMQRAQTVGHHIWNIGVTGQYLELDEFDGEGVARDPDPIIVPGRGAVRFFATPKFVYHLATVNVTYGLLENLDLNLAVPFAAADFDTNVSFVGTGGNFTFVNEHVKESFDIRDLVARAKYRFCEMDRFSAAVGIEAMFPTGDPDQAFGTGDYQLGPFLAASTVFWDRVEPYWNAGFLFDVEDSNQSSGHYAFGVAVQAVKDWLDFGVSFLGNSQFDGVRSAGSVSGLHQTASGPALAPYEGLNFDRKDAFDFNGGASVRLFRTLVLTVSATKALNEDGLRSSGWSPVGALQATF